MTGFGLRWASACICAANTLHKILVLIDDAFRHAPRKRDHEFFLISDDVNPFGRIHAEQTRHGRIR